MSPTKLALNLAAGSLGLYALARLVLGPLYELLHLGVREHGSFLEDVDFYYTLIAQSLLRFGQAFGLAFCLLGLTCAFTTVLGFSVDPLTRARARLCFWYVPVFWFFLDLLGRYQVQLWYANHGILFPATSFLRDFAPDLGWLAATWLVTAPAILTGRGLFLLLPVSLEAPPPPVPPVPPP